MSPTISNPSTPTPFDGGPLKIPGQCHARFRDIMARSFFWDRIAIRHSAGAICANRNHPIQTYLKHQKLLWAQGLPTWGQVVYTNLHWKEDRHGPGLVTLLYPAKPLPGIHPDRLATMAIESQPPTPVGDAQNQAATENRLWRTLAGRVSRIAQAGPDHDDPETPRCFKPTFAPPALSNSGVGQTAENRHGAALLDVAQGNFRLLAHFGNHHAIFRKCSKACCGPASRDRYLRWPVTNRNDPRVDWLPGLQKQARL